MRDTIHLRSMPLIKRKHCPHKNKSDNNDQVYTRQKLYSPYDHDNNNEYKVQLDDLAWQCCESSAARNYERGSAP